MSSSLVTSIFTLGVQGPPGPPGPGSALTGLTLISTNITLVSGQFAPIDTRVASVTLTMPPAIDGAIVGLVDVFGQSTLRPIVILANGAGVTVADPSNPGNYGTTVHIAQQGATVWWLYCAAAGNLWVPIWW